MVVTATELTVVEPQETSEQLSRRRQLVELGASRLIYCAFESEAEEALELLTQNDIAPNVSVRNGVAYEDAGWLISSSYKRRQSLVSGVVLGIDGDIYSTRKMIASQYQEIATTAEGREAILTKGGSQLIPVAQPHRMRDVIKALSLPSRREERDEMLGSEPNVLAVFYGSCRTLLDTYLEQRELKQNTRESHMPKLGMLATQIVHGQIDRVQRRVVPQVWT